MGAETLRKKSSQIMYGKGFVALCCASINYVTLWKMSLQCHVIGVFQTGAQNLEMVAFQSSGSSQFLGIAFLGIGLWAWNEKGVLSNISSITDLGGFDPVWLFLVVGGVMFILGFAGCIGALRENTFLLKFFSVFLGIIFFLELTAGVLAFVFKDWIKDQLYFFINNNIRAYRDDIDLQNLIDFTQEYWQCCGAFGADDWNLNIYFNCTDSNASRERCGVPFSCCTKDPAVFGEELYIVLETFSERACSFCNQTAPCHLFILHRLNCENGNSTLGILFSTDKTFSAECSSIYHRCSPVPLLY
ncbi:tetraspanin-5 isoform X2 [Parus major]|uniref:tetraspanin-5 isoform X2 n=1 Tax=Parus major TaxID=9157 RepID=UPI00144498CA|nr:tetraspanin-5 isoform X2 [Parus major]